MSDDPFLDRPTYEELRDMEPSPEEMLDSSLMSEPDSWYNQAPYVAARLIIEAARENEDFRVALMTTEEFGVAHQMSEYDEERYDKLNSIGLSSFQGGNAENMARRYFREEI